jgi:hypothetical protein
MSTENTPLSTGRFRRRADAARYLKEKYGVGSVGALERMATLGGGPRFHKMGRCTLYAERDLDEWALSNLSRSYATTREAKAEGSK